MTESNNGTIALVGSGEYLPPMQVVDKALLELLSSTPHVVVLPTAAAPDGPEVTTRWAQMGIEHFTQLGATAESAMLLTREDASKNEIVERISAANFIYLSGGKPRYLFETLQGTPAWRAMVSVFTAGGVIAGCSAGAMALAGDFFDFPQVWRTVPALGLVPGIAVIPHFDELPGVFVTPMSLAARKVTVVGIEGTTALVGSGEQWTVVGRGGVTVFSGNHKMRYTAGQQVPLYKKA